MPVSRSASTDTPSAARRRSHPSPPDPAHADYGSLTGASAVPAAAALSWPIARPAAANRHPEHAASWSSVKSFSPSQIDGRPLRTFLLGYALSSIGDFTAEATTTGWFDAFERHARCR